MAVGKELLIGRTLNTNAHWMGKRLALMGTMIKEMTTVDDDLEEISRALTSTLARTPDFIVVIGGLGPTPDDMTLRGVAAGLGRRLSLNKKAIVMIKDHYIRRGLGGIEITPARKKMAVLPGGGRPLMNVNGTAPGVKLEAGGTVVFCLPGVPSEMRGIFRRSIEPEIRSRLGELHRRAITMKIEGVYESALAPVIQGELKRNPGVYIKSHPRGIREGVSRIELDVVAVGKDNEIVSKVATGIARRMSQAVKDAGGVLKAVRGLD